MAPNKRFKWLSAKLQLLVRSGDVSVYEVYSSNTVPILFQTASLTLVPPILGRIDERCEVLDLSVMQMRQLNDVERRLIDCLLQESFAGREAILEQINTSLVRQIDENGSLEFDVGRVPMAVPKFRIPVEGESEDVDGVPIHVLLHVVDGRVKELEIYKDDSSLVLKMPEPEKLRLFRPD